MFFLIHFILLIFSLCVFLILEDKMKKIFIKHIFCGMFFFCMTNMHGMQQQMSSEQDVVNFTRTCLQHMSDYPFSLLEHILGFHHCSPSVESMLGGDIDHIRSFEFLRGRIFVRLDNHEDGSVTMSLMRGSTAFGNMRTISEVTINQADREVLLCAMLHNPQVVSEMSVASLQMGLRDAIDVYRDLPDSDRRLQEAYQAALEIKRQLGQ